jgi:hypothetical protein
MCADEAPMAIYSINRESAPAHQRIDATHQHFHAASCGKIAGMLPFFFAVNSRNFLK